MPANSPPALTRLRALPASVWALFSVQACIFVCVSMLITSVALTGARIAPSAELSTLPFGLQVMAVMLFSFPAAWLMQRIGRKTGIMGGLTIGLIAGGLGCWALLYPNFPLLCFTHLLLGVMQASANQIRFAAADEVAEEQQPLVLSLILTAGIAGALLGPPLAIFGQNLLGTAVFAGIYLLAVMLMLLALIIILPISIKRLPPADDGDPSLADDPQQSGVSRLLGALRQPGFALAAISGAVGYGVMTLLMTATPLAMEGCGFVFTSSAMVIQWHVLAMFIPSLGTGTLIGRIGARWVLRLGIGFNLLAILVTLSGIDLANFGVGLVLLGLGWNFMFISATSLAARIGQGRDRLLVQGSFDAFVFGCSTMAAFASGWLNSSFGWQAVNLGVAPLLMLAAIASFAAAAPLGDKSR